VTPPTSYFKQLAIRCNRIAAEITDATGFVSVERLVKRFGASLIIRPLLVEAMVASSEPPTDCQAEGNHHEWCLLLDRETHNVAESEIANERFGSPLSARLRNTVAHELAHTLAFRPKEFGVEPPPNFSPEKPKKEFVDAIERETERLSPLLLLPDTLLDREFSPDREEISIQELCAIMRNAGVSRSVLLNRLKLLELVDDKRVRSRPCLANVAIGIGEWVSEVEARFKAWPLFLNFEGGKVPGFLFQLQKRIPLPAKSVVSDTQSYLCGGSSEGTDCVLPAGTPRHPTALNLPTRIMAEMVRRKPGSEFLFLVRSLATPD